MRHVQRVLVILLLISLFASAKESPQQEDSHHKLHDAIVLERQGQFERAIPMIGECVHSEQLTEAELGRAYVMLGVAYHEQNNFVEAQRAIERSLQILQHEAGGETDYSSALENYGRLYGDAGEFDAAEAMWQKALRLREQIGDHTAAMRSLLNLSQLALVRKQVKVARRYLAGASDQMTLARDLSDDDRTYFFETQGWLALAEHEPAAAIASFQYALDLCQRDSGEQQWLIGWEYVLRGKAYAESGDFKQAASDMQIGLTIIEHALGQKNPKYMVSAFAYSQVLERTGARKEAAQLRQQAKQVRKDLYDSQCVGCTINVAGFR